MNLPQFERFSVHEEPATVGKRWAKYVKRLDNLFTAFAVTDAKQRRALLLHYAGPEVSDVFDTLPDTGEDYKSAKAALEKHFCPSVNIEYERFVFRQCRQNEDETVDQYCHRLQKLAVSCDFTDSNAEIKSQIILGCRSQKLRRHALRDTITLDKLLSTARAYEQADRHAAVMEGTEATTTTVQAVGARTRPVYHQRQSQQQQHAEKTERRTCYNCGGFFPHRYKPCPATGQTCHACGRQNHLAKYCLSKNRSKVSQQVQASTTISSDTNPQTLIPDPEPPSTGQYEHYQFHVEAKTLPKPTVTVHVNGTPISAVIDTGASVMMMSQRTFAQPRPQPRLVAHSVPVYGYGNSTPLDVNGTFTATVSYKSSSANAEIYVTSHDGDTLLNFATATTLGLVELAYATSATPKSVYPDRFTGIGKLNKYRYHIQADMSVSPVAIPHRRIPFHMRDKVVQELDRLLECDIIEKVENTPTPWVSPITVVPKRNSEAIRICVDMRNVNTAIKRERHIIPTVDDLIASLNGATTFSTLDLNSGYHQIELNSSKKSCNSSLIYYISLYFLFSALKLVS